MSDERKFLNLGCCPFCGSGKIHVTSTTKPRRRFKCKVCKKNWTCLEIVESDMWLPGVLTVLLHQGRFSHYDLKTKAHIVAICNEFLTHM